MISLLLALLVCLSDRIEDILMLTLTRFWCDVVKLSSPSPMAWTFLRQEIAELGTDIHLSHGLLGRHVGMLATTYTHNLSKPQISQSFQFIRTWHTWHRWFFVCCSQFRSKKAGVYESFIDKHTLPTSNGLKFIRKESLSSDSMESFSQASS